MEHRFRFHFVKLSSCSLYQGIFTSLAPSQGVAVMCSLHWGPPSVGVSSSVVSDSLWPHGLRPASLLCPWDSPGKNTGMNSHFLLQGIFQTQGSNPGLLHWRQILYCLSHQGDLQTGQNPKCWWRQGVWGMLMEAGSVREVGWMGNMANRNKCSSYREQLLFSSSLLPCRRGSLMWQL